MGLSAKTCRHLIAGYCSNFYWTTMKSGGRLGIGEYACRLWKSKLDHGREHGRILDMARQMGLSEARTADQVHRFEAQYRPRMETCPDFIPHDEHRRIHCRYLFMDACLLRFPLCVGECDDFLPFGDQESDTRSELPGYAKKGSDQPC